MIEFQSLMGEFGKPQALRGRWRTLNNAAVPNVNELNDGEVNWLFRHAECHIGAFEGEILVGLLLILPGTPNRLAYDSANYDWFCSRFDAFSYVDRILVDPAYHRQNIGRGLYQAAFTELGANTITSEVNKRPANAPSLAFHQKMGFREIDDFENPQSGKLVSMMMKPGS
ncbi:MAG: GNAT family N-acetyltransferase [Pseudomonadota bacterium]